MVEAAEPEESFDASNTRIAVGVLATELEGQKQASQCGNLPEWRTHLGVFGCLRIASHCQRTQGELHWLEAAKRCA